MFVEKKRSGLYINNKKLRRGHGFHCEVSNPKFFIVEKIPNGEFLIIGCTSTLKDARTYLEYIKIRTLANSKGHETRYRESFKEVNNEIIGEISINSKRFYLISK